MSVNRFTSYDDRVEMILKTAAFADLDVITIYRLLKLRMEVFIIEQDCAFLDIDDRDIEPLARHLWFEQDRRPLAYLRVLDDGEVVRIGRVVTAKTARGRGLAGELLTTALVAVGGRPVALDAQKHLAGFYGRYGFAANGPEYLDNDISHLPMLRPAAR